MTTHNHTTFKRNAVHHKEFCKTRPTGSLLLTHRNHPLGGINFYKNFHVRPFTKRKIDIEIRSISMLMKSVKEIVSLQKKINRKGSEVKRKRNFLPFCYFLLVLFIGISGAFKNERIVNNKFKYPLQIYRSNGGPFFLINRSCIAICSGLKNFNNNCISIYLHK